MSSACPICDHGEAMSIDERPKVAVMQNRVFASAAAARACATAPLAMAGCLRCGFVWNRVFDAARIGYGPDYENCQLNSAAFSAHVGAVAGRVIAAVPDGAPVDLLEIGCGQADFMRLVAARAGDRLGSAVGFDPSWRGEVAPAGMRLHRAYFGRDTAHLLDRAPNVVVMRHIIEHVPDPSALLADIRAALGGRDGVALFVETPTVAWILDNEAVQDFFYEHCSLFTVETMDFALRRAGFAPLAIDPVFGGQYLLAEARIAPAASDGTAPPPPVGAWRAYAAGRQRFLDAWRAVFKGRPDRGRLAVWGAGAKGASFVQLLDPDAELIDCVIDINPNKQGGFVPVTGHAVVSPEDAARRGVAAIVAMNPNYADEIAAECARVGLAGAELMALNG